MSCKIGDNSAVCGKSCKTCIPIDERCKQKRCPSVPVVKEFHQGIIMSGNGGPPNTDASLADPPLIVVPPVETANNPVPQCFYYEYFYDFTNNRLFTLEKDLDGNFAGYSIAEDGDLILKQLFRITSAGNIGAQGTVLSSDTLLSLQTCLNAQSAASNSFAVAGSANPILRKFNCAINASNMGSVGFVYMDQAPTPAYLEFLQSGAGYTLTPDYVLTGGDFTPTGYKFTVYVRDKRNGRYYRDSYNSPENDPDFPPNAAHPLRPCDGELHKYCSLTYEFDASTCRWYLLADSNELNPDGIGGGSALLPLKTLDCKCDCGVPEPPCPGECDCCDSH